MPAPALVSTSTLWPWWISSRADEGTRPTRSSWVLISLGTPISMIVSRHRRILGRANSWAELGPIDRGGRYHGGAGSIPQRHSLSSRRHQFARWRRSRNPAAPCETAIVEWRVASLQGQSPSPLSLQCRGEARAAGLPDPAFGPTKSGFLASLGMINEQLIFRLRRAAASVCRFFSWSS